MSLSTAHQEKTTRTLKQWLENDRRVVTYRDVSREIGCHVNLAKNLLLAYHSSHQVTATYLLTGPLLRHSTLTYTQLPPTAPSSPPTATQSLAHLGGQVKIVDMDQMSDDERNSEHDEEDDDVRLTNDDGAYDDGAMGIKRDEGDEGELEREEVPRWGVVMVSEEGLEEKKKLFEVDKLSIHIYALSPAPIKDPGQYLVSNLALRSRPNYHSPSVYGTISGDAFKPAPDAMRDGGINFNAAPVKKKEEKPAPKKDAQYFGGRRLKPDRYNKVEPADSKSDTTASSSKKPVTEEKRSKSPEKAAPAASATKKTGTTKLGPTSSDVREDEAAMAAMMGMEMDEDIGMDGDEPSGEAASTSATPAPVQVKAKPGERKRKRRIVKKSKMEMDDKGYMVTKDYDTEESYSGDSEPEQSTASSKTKAKPQPAAKTKVPPAPSRTASTTSVESDKKPNISNLPKTGSSGSIKQGKGGQSTLQGFFKKK